jgi:hypothetical protein
MLAAEAWCASALSVGASGVTLCPGQGCHQGDVDARAYSCFWVLMGMGTECGCS